MPNEMFTQFYNLKDGFWVLLIILFFLYLSIDKKVIFKSFLISTKLYVAQAKK